MIQLSPEKTEQLRHFAQARQLSENQVVEKALDIFFSLIDVLDKPEVWTFLSEESLQKAWDNEADAAYNNWRELYDIPTG
jgi:hypothetical protein